MACLKMELFNKNKYLMNLKMIIIIKKIFD